MITPNSLSSWQQFFLVLFRFSVGWHLFYQGLGKLQAVHWSAEPYLRSATGPLAAIFHKMAESPKWLAVGDHTTIWGLMIVGMLLMLGLFTRSASAGAILLLLLFYTAHPPLPAHGFAVATIEGSELYVNKLFIEMIALLVCLVFDTGKISGLDVWVHHRFRSRRSEARLQTAATMATEKS